MKTILFSPLLLLVLATGCASSNHQVTGVKRPSFPPEAVGIYSSMPAHAEVIGFVSANSYDGMTLNQANKDALSMLKVEAGKLGANGVVIIRPDDTELSGARIKARAVYVTPEVANNFY